MDYRLLPEEDLPVMNDFVLSYTITGVSLPPFVKETLTSPRVSLSNSIVEVLTQHVALGELLQSEAVAARVNEEAATVSSEVDYELPISIEGALEVEMVSIENQAALGEPASIQPLDSHQYEVQTADGKTFSLSCSASDHHPYLILTDHHQIYTVNTAKSIRRAG